MREARGLEHTLQLDQTRGRHVRHGWVGTVHGSQGATADRSMTHLESFRANTVDAKSAYIAISRAAVYTDSKEKLADAIEMRNEERTAALEPERGATDRCGQAPANTRVGMSGGKTGPPRT